jgi:hypothetical protein
VTVSHRLVCEEKKINAGLAGLASITSSKREMMSIVCIVSAKQNIRQGVDHGFCKVQFMSL